MALWSCWILAGTGTFCHTRWSRASQTYSTGWLVWWVCRPLKWHWRWLMVEKLTFNYLVTVLLDITAVGMPIAHYLKTWDNCVTKLHILEWPCIVPSTMCTGVMIMLFNQLLDVPHLSGGWIILAKEKSSLTQM
jgi:hypothetical protein